MRWMWCGALIFFGIYGNAVAQDERKFADLPMAVSYQFVPQFVTTEEIGKLDPDLPNPHHQRWVFNRKIELKGLEVRKLSSDRYGVQTQGLESRAMGYIRGNGPWFRSIREFPCTKEFQEKFSTAEGARYSVDLAGKEWKELLRNEIPALSLSLEKISENLPQIALKNGLQTYQLWLRRLEKNWRERVLSEIRLSEWRFYQSEAAHQWVCSKKKSSESSDLRGDFSRASPWASMMEKPASLSPQSGWQKPLSRAPARRWDGLFSVRLGVTVGSRTLVGQFLIDSDSPKSILSSAWLNGAGILPERLEVRGVAPERFSVLGEKGMAPVASVDRVTLSGLSLDLDEFLIYETDFFLPPEHLSTCCDGVLGSDFLKKYVVQFSPGKSNELLIWPRQGFSPEVGPRFAEPVWIETHLNSQGQWVSEDCRWISSAGASSPVVIHWSTVNENAFVAARGDKQLGPSGKLECDGQVLGRTLDIKPSSQIRAQSSIRAGIGFLARGSFVFDFPHGRIWFPKATLEAPVLKNNSGLSVKFFKPDDDRVLKVVQVAPGSRAAALIKQGLKPGRVIDQVDSRSVAEMDHWEIEQHLAGAYGDTVTLRWLVGKVAKTGFFKVR